MFVFRGQQSRLKMRSRLQSEDIGVRLQIVSAMLDYLTRTIVIARTRSVFIGVNWDENGEIFFLMLKHIKLWSN